MYFRAVLLGLCILAQALANKRVVFSTFRSDYSREFLTSEDYKIYCKTINGTESPEPYDMTAAALYEESDIIREDFWFEWNTTIHGDVLNCTVIESDYLSELADVLGWTLVTYDQIVSRGTEFDADEAHFKLRCLDCPMYFTPGRKEIYVRRAEVKTVREDIGTPEVYIHCASALDAHRSGYRLDMPWIVTDHYVTDIEERLFVWDSVDPYGPGGVMTCGVFEDDQDNILDTDGDEGMGTWIMTYDDIDSTVLEIRAWQANVWLSSTCPGCDEESTVRSEFGDEAKRVVISAIRMDYDREWLSNQDLIIKAFNGDLFGPKNYDMRTYAMYEEVEYIMEDYWFNWDLDFYGPWLNFSVIESDYLDMFADSVGWVNITYDEITTAGIMFDADEAHFSLRCLDCATPASTGVKSLAIKEIEIKATHDTLTPEIYVECFSAEDARRNGYRADLLTVVTDHVLFEPETKVFDWDIEDEYGPGYVITCGVFEDDSNDYFDDDGDEGLGTFIVSFDDLTESGTEFTFWEGTIKVYDCPDCASGIPIIGSASKTQSTFSVLLALLLSLVVAEV